MNTTWILLGVAGVGAVLLLKPKKKVNSTGGVTTASVVMPPPARAPLPEPVPAPSGYMSMFEEHLDEAMDACIAVLEPYAGLTFDQAFEKTRICTLQEIFPEAVWPPPSNAHQWQRNLWGGQVGLMKSKFTTKRTLPGMPS